jgi:hypothetical protein
MAIVAIYNGDLVGSARLVSATGDPEVVTRVAELLLEVEREDSTAPEPIAAGRCIALRSLVGGESHE